MSSTLYVETGDGDAPPADLISYHSRSDVNRVPILKTGNYHAWERGLKLVLVNHDLWGIVSLGFSKTEASTLGLSLRTGAGPRLTIFDLLLAPELLTARVDANAVTEMTRNHHTIHSIGESSGAAPLRNTWIGDTGAHRHFVGDRSLLRNFTLDPVMVRVANGSPVLCKGYGSITVRTNKNHTLNIQKVYHLPGGRVPGMGLFLS